MKRKRGAGSSSSSHTLIRRHAHAACLGSACPQHAGRPGPCPLCLSPDSVGLVLRADGSLRVGSRSPTEQIDKLSPCALRDSPVRSEKRSLVLPSALLQPILPMTSLHDQPQPRRAHGHQPTLQWTPLDASDRVAAEEVRRACQHPHQQHLLLLTGPHPLSPLPVTPQSVRASHSGTIPAGEMARMGSVG